MTGGDDRRENLRRLREVVICVCIVCVLVERESGAENV